MARTRASVTIAAIAIGIARVWIPALACAQPSDPEAEPGTGSVGGAIIDKATQARLPGATLVLASPELAQPRSTITDDTGGYVFGQLAPAIYNLTIYAGSSVFNRGQIRVEPSTDAIVNVFVDTTPRMDAIVDTGALWPVVLAATRGIGASFGVSSDRAIVSELHGSLPVASFGDAWLRVTPHVQYSHAERGASHPSAAQIGVAIDYVRWLARRIELGGGIGGGIDITRDEPHAVEPWLEARVAPSVRLLHARGAAGAHYFEIDRREAVDIVLQLRLVRQLDDARTIGIAELGLDVLWW